MAAPHPTVDLTLRQEGSPQTKRGRPSPRQRTTPVPNPPGDQPWRVTVIAIALNGPALMVPVSAAPSTVAPHSRFIGSGTLMFLVRVCVLLSTLPFSTSNETSAHAFCPVRLEKRHMGRELGRAYEIT